MEYIVEKIGMSRTIAVPSVPVTLLKVIEAKVCEVDESKRALVAYVSGKKMNKAIAGQQKKYSLSAEFNRFVTLDVANTEKGDLDTAPLSEAKNLKVTLTLKVEDLLVLSNVTDFLVVLEHMVAVSIEDQVQLVTVNGQVVYKKGRKMPGHYGNVKVTVRNDVVSFDAENGILALKGAVPGANGAMGRVRIVK